MKKISIELNDKQSEFLLSNKKQLALCSGLGGGKSFALYLSFIVNEVLKYKESIHCIGALSYQQLKDVSYPYVIGFLDEFGIRYSFNKSDNTIILRNKEKTKILMRSAEVADRMRSVEIGSLYCEEMAYWSEESFLTFLGRLRHPKGSRRLRAVSTPNGFNHFYKFFIEKKDENRDILFTSTYANKHLPKEYIKMLETSYDSDLQQQELHGKFVNVGAGRTYYKFDRNYHVKDLSGMKLPAQLSVGMDFNVNPMTAVIGFFDNDTLYIVNELYLKNSNTFKMAETLEAQYGSNLLVIPDATGSARKTAAVKSDHEILKEHFTVARVRNPHRKDRFNCVNNMLDKGKIVIDKMCTHLITDLDRFADDDSDKMLGHISDALGYLCWHYQPIKRHSSQSAMPNYL